MFQAKVAEKIKNTPYVKYFFKKMVAFCEIMRKNIVQPDRPQMTV